MPSNQHEINVRVDSSLYQLESILESLQGLVQGGLASFFDDFNRIDPRRVEHIKYLMNQLNQSQASRDLGDSLKTITEQMESIVSALDIAQHIKAPIVERGFPHLVKNFNDAIQKHYESIDKYISELFAATPLTATRAYIPALLRSTRGDIAAQLSRKTQEEIADYLTDFDQRIDNAVRQRYADYFDRFSTVTPPPRPSEAVPPTTTTVDALKQTLFEPIPQVDFKTENEAVANYTISQNKIGIGREFANLPPKAKNFVLQHELGHRIFTRFQGLFPQRFEEIIRSGVIGTWEGEQFQGVFGRERTSPHETLANLYAYYMTNPRKMRESHPKQYEFIDQFLSQEIFQNDVMNFAFRKISERQAKNIRKLYSTGEYTKTALAKKYGISVKTLNKVLNPPTPTTTVESSAPEEVDKAGKPTIPPPPSVEVPGPKWEDRPYSPIPVLKPPPAQPIITPPKEITVPQPPQIIAPQEPPKEVITPTAEEVKKYGTSTIPKEPPSRPKQTTEVPNRSLEMMNRWLEREYQVAAQLLKESRDGRKDSQKQAFDLKHLLAISAEARLEALEEALEHLENIYVATGKDRPITETFIRENIAETTRAKTASQIQTLLLNQGLQPHQVNLLTEKYMKLIEDSLPPPPPPPPPTTGGGEWGWGDVARSMGKFALNRTVGGLFNAFDIIIDKAGLSLADIISRGMTINENLYYPLEMTMAGRMRRLMRAGGAAGFPEEFYTAMEEMWGQAIPTELAGVLMSSYTALLGSTTMENLAQQIIPLTNIARTIGVGPEQLLQPVAGVLRMMPERGTPQVYNQLAESIAKAIANADLTEAIGTDELLRIFTTLSKSYFGGAAEITPQSVQNALSAVSFLTTFGAPGLQGAIGLENLARLNQSLMGRGVALTPLLYLGANYQAPEWGTNTLEKLVNISSQFAREGIFMQNRGTNEIFLFSLLRQVREMAGGDKSLATAILAREGNISTDIALALFDLQDTLEEQLESGKATSETLNTLVSAVIQGDQKAIEVMTRGTEVEQMQYYQLLEANSIYDQLIKDAGQLPLQIATQGKKQLSPLLDKVYSALARGVQGDVRGAFNELVKAFSELPNIEREGAAIMAHSALRSLGLTPQNFLDVIKQSLPTVIGTTTGVALGPAIAANISTILPWIIPAVVAAVGAYLGFEQVKNYNELSREQKDYLNQYKEEILPSLQEEGKSQEEIKDIEFIWKALTDFQTKQISPHNYRQSIYQYNFKNIPPETFEQVYSIAVKEGLGDEFIELLGMFAQTVESVKEALKIIQAKNETAIPSGPTLTLNAEPPSEQPSLFPSTGSEVSPENEPVQASPLSEFVVEKSEETNKPTFPASNNYTNHYNFTINVTPLPGESPEDTANRIASQILQYLEETQVNDTRNRSAGQ